MPIKMFRKLLIFLCTQQRLQAPDVAQCNSWLQREYKHCSIY